MIKYICAIIKDEHNYIEEWLDYHFSIGFDKVYLFEDGGESHLEIIKKYGDKVIHTTLLDSVSRSHSRQYEVYKKAFDIVKGKCDWCAFIDIDEFITLAPKYEGNIENFLKEYEDYPCVHLAWKNFGANGRLEPCEKGKTIETYTEPIKMRLDCFSCVKSIVNAKHKDARITNVHHMRHSVNTDFGEQERPLYNKAWINHYYTRSLTDWVAKVKRGQLFSNVYDIKRFFRYNPDMDYDKYVGYANRLLLGEMD